MAVRDKVKNGKPMSADDKLNELHKKVQSKDFNNIFSMGSEQRIDDLKYPQKMRNMQKLVVKDLSSSDELRRKVSILLHNYVANCIMYNIMCVVIDSYVRTCVILRNVLFIKIFIMNIRI